MAEDVELISGDTDSVTDDRVNIDVEMSSPPIHVSTSNNDVSSTESFADIIIDVVSTGEAQPPDLVSSNSDAVVPNTPIDVAQACDCSDTVLEQGQRSRSPNNKISICESSTSTTAKDTNIYSASSTCEIIDSRRTRSVSNCPSDYDCDIIVDDSPQGEESSKDRLISAIAQSSENENIKRNKAKVAPICIDSNGDGSVNLIKLNRLSRSGTPSPSIHSFTPSTPGTPRQRSGSVSGTTYASPSPRPSTRGTTPGERQRAGSMGEIEMRDRNGSKEFKHGIQIIDNLDILQIPRPRNPGGVLPQNGLDLEDNHDDFDMIINLRQPSKRKSNGDHSQATSTFTNYLSSNTISTTAAITTSANTSYLISNIIRTTPNKLISKTSNVLPSSLTVPYPRSNMRTWTSSINESIERPQPSSVVDNEGVAKKIARLDSHLCSSSVDGLWPGRLNSQTDSQAFRNLHGVADRTPPERPKPPRLGLSPLPDNSSIDVSGDRFISPSRRRRLSPVSSALSQLQSSAQSQDGEDLSMYRMSPDSEISPIPGSNSRYYKCRMCHFTSASYIVLQQHMLKHGDNVKIFSCPLCDYTTNEKSQFRRHRRLHNKGTPVNLLRCGKCSYSSTLPRKMRDHYHQIHRDIGTPGMSSELTDRNLYTPQRSQGTRNGGTAIENISSYPAGGSYYNTANIDNLLLNRNERVGFSYPNPRQQPINYSLDQFNPPYGEVQARDETMASSYLRSIVSSIMNSEASSRPSVTSTITSSGYFATAEMDNSHHLSHIDNCSTHNCRNSNCTSVGVKVKIEPDLDENSDISSTANSCTAATPDIPRHSLDSQSQVYTDVNNLQSLGSFTNGNADSSLDIHRPRHRSLDASLLTRNTQPVSHDVPTDLTSPRKMESRSNMVTRATVATDMTPRSTSDLENGSDLHTSLNLSSLSSTIVKSDHTTRGVQCVLPLIKTEIDLDGDYYDFYGTQRLRFRGIDRAVQCDLYTVSTSATPNTNTNTTNTSTRSQAPRLSTRTQSVSESELSEHHSSQGGEMRCEHCGIVFDDDVIYSIHIGCHSHTEPFKCNVCGKQCGNKYGFYSHIMRGHQF